MASDSDRRRHRWRRVTCRRVQRGTVDEPTIVGKLDRWVYAAQSDDSAHAGLLDGQGHARARGGRVSALTRR